MMIQRKKVIPLADGNVLEIGIGSGLNLPYYDSDNVRHIVGIDPTPYSKGLEEAISISPIETEVIIGLAEKLPMEGQLFDTVVSTYSFCTIGNLDLAIEEIKRVLKPEGKIIFCEHGLAPDMKVQKVQNRINPLWKKLAGGCHLNRDIPLILEESGLKIDQMDTMYLPGWKPATYNFWGVCRIN
jgi:ubiquinone/menaquinone biosynthesis C-methylase UbiE